MKLAHFSGNFIFIFLFTIGLFICIAITPLHAASPSPSASPSTGNGDVNNDGFVNYNDLLQVFTNWLRSLTIRVDQYGDSKINSLDFAVVKSNWPLASSPTPAATATPQPSPSASPMSSGCDFTIATSVSTANGKGNFSAVRPGNTVCIAAGNRSKLTLIDFTGTAAAPIVFKNSGDKVMINDPQIGIEVYGSQFVHVSGAGVAGLFYGIEIANTANSGFNTNHVGSDGLQDGTGYIEADHMYIHNVGAGIRSAKNNDLTSGSWTGHQFYYHDINIAHTDNEGMYIGSSTTGGVFPIHDVQIYNNRVEDTGYDGIQVRQGNTRVLVHDNYISGTGRNPCKGGTIDNSGGFNIAKDTQIGDWYNNTVVGARTAFYTKDANNVRVFNNLAIDSGHATSGLSGPECPTGVTSTPPEGTAQIINSSNIQYMFNTFVNNTVDAAYGVDIRSSTGTFHDNIIGGTFTTLISGSGMILTSNLTNRTMSFFQFVNPTSNWHLTITSPAVDTASISTFPLVDIEGFPRPYGTKSDIGAFEYHP